MADHKATVDALAALMDEFGLADARLRIEGITVAFSQRSHATQEVLGTPAAVQYYSPGASAPVAEVPKGTPITSPMTGIYYSSPSPSSPPFVREGDTVTAGQSIGLIEAMKVFNEIPATASGTVLKMVAESGQLVQPGDVLLIVG